MPNQKDRVIIDTNIWISFLLIKNNPNLDALLSDKFIVLLFSEELINEFIEVTKRSKFKKYFSLADIQVLLTQLKFRADFINVTSKVSICRDPKDNFLLALSKDGNATHLITGDKDLLDLKKFEKTQILSMADYLTQ